MHEKGYCIRKTVVFPTCVINHKSVHNNNANFVIKKYTFRTGFFRDKTMAEKSMYIPNDDTKIPLL